MGKDIRKRDIYDDVFVANTERIFYVKGKWKASMIMALLFTSITEEKACTSMARTGVYHQHIHLQNSQSWTQL